jgi:5-methyltetrahydrofolate--homocysteine methyltransferase
MNDLLKPLYEAIVNGNQKDALAHVQAALDAGLDPIVILNDGMIAAMQKVGSLFQAGEYFVPEMLIAARAMQSGLALLKPRLVQSNYKPIGKVVIGTVKGDLHDIGKNLVAMMLEGAAFEIIDLGVDVSPEKFVNAVKEHQPQLVGMSALLTTTMPSMKTTIDALTVAGLRERVKVMIGGAPVTETYAKQIGADAYAPDASRAAALAKNLISIEV